MNDIQGPQFWSLFAEDVYKSVMIVGPTWVDWNGTWFANNDVVLIDVCNFYGST